METHTTLRKFGNKLIVTFVKGGKTYRTIGKLYRKFIKSLFLRFGTKDESNSETNNITSILIKFKLKIKKVNKMMLIYSILKSSFVEKYVMGLNRINNERLIKLCIEIEEDLKLTCSHNSLYMRLNTNNKSKFTMCYLLTDYLALSSSNIPNLFESTLNQIISKSNQKYTYLRLPQYYFENFGDNFTNVSNLIEMLKTFNDLIKVECLTLNLNYYENIDKNCKKNYFQISVLISNIILEILTIFQEKFIIIHLIIAHVDECFPLNLLFEALQSFLMIIPNKKFIVNIRTLTHINHPIDDGSDPEAKFFIGKSIFINKVFCKVENFDMVYLFFFILRKGARFQKLSKKYIMLLIGRFLLKFNLYDVDKRNDSGISNLEQSGNSPKLRLPREVTKLFKFSENLDETKLLIFGKEYNPLEK